MSRWWTSCGIRSFDGGRTFHERLDMLPESNAVADIVCKLDEVTGAVAWRISSFDPATMNVTEDKEFAINAEQFF